MVIEQSEHGDNRDKEYGIDGVSLAGEIPFEEIEMDVNRKHGHSHDTQRVTYREQGGIFCRTDEEVPAAEEKGPEIDVIGDAGIAYFQ